MTHWQHPRYFAYFATSASEPAILAEMLAATLNSVAILWRTAPAATELEGLVLDWVADLLGLPGGWHGHIEDSASTSTLAAIIAAREATGRRVVVCSEQAHSSVAKAARMLDMELRTVPCDEAFRMRVEPLAEGLADAAAVVATVGTTATTSVDPVAEIAPLCAAARGPGCTSMPPMPGRPWCAPSTGGRSPESSTPIRSSSTPTSGC